MKIYVSGSVHDIPRVHAVQDALREARHVITHDWTRYYGPKRGDSAFREMLKQRQGIAKADGFVLVVHPLLKAGWMEFGMALHSSSGCHCVVINHPAVSDSMWYESVKVSEVDSIEEAVACFD